MKKYYENHKEEIKQKVKEYKEKTNYVVPKEVIKERNKRAYQKRKEKLEKEKIENI
jgi:dsDNA-specific endonuclease/ATPase MutS2